MGELPFQEPRFSYARFDLQNIDEAECLAEFRVQKQDIPVMANVLQLPVNINCPQRTICNTVEGLCMLLNWKTSSRVMHDHERSRG